MSTSFMDVSTLHLVRIFASIPAVCASRCHRLCGALLLSAALVACGQVDLVIEAGLYPYDVQAPIAVIEAAGGIVTDWQGAPCPQGGRVLAAANPEIHAEALAILRQTP